MQQALFDELLAFGSATIHEAQGQVGAMDSAIKPIDPSMKLVGRALTVESRPGDNLVVHYALLKAKPGEVLVIDAKGFIEAGLWGDVLTDAAISVGIKGVIINGSTRDCSEICERGFPTFARGVSIRGTLKNQPGTVGHTITCAGVVVCNGDIVVGDRDGVVVIPAGRVDAIAEKARRRAEKENEFRAALRGGQTTVDLLGLHDQLRGLGMH